MAERKSLTIIEVSEIQKVGSKQIPKLSFLAKDGDTDLRYFTFKSSLFEAIKEGQTINADVETSTREWQGQEYTDRKVVQIYVDGQPVVSKGGGYRGKSPEELEQTARLMILAYAKDLAVADKIPVVQIANQADVFYSWLKGNGNKPAKQAKTEEQEFESLGKPETEDLSSLNFKNPGEFYTACLEHLNISKSKVDAEIPEYDITKVDQRKRAWQQILAIYGQKPNDN